MRGNTGLIGSVTTGKGTMGVSEHFNLTKNNTIENNEVGFRLDVGVPNLNRPEIARYYMLGYTNFEGVFVAPHGKYFYTVHSTESYGIRQYLMTNRHEIGSASYYKDFVPNQTSQYINATAIYFRDDGKTVYILNRTGSTSFISEFSLSSPWEIDTATFVQVDSFGSFHVDASDAYFKPDGTAVFVTDTTHDYVRRYNMSTAWDISTMSGVIDEYDATSIEATPQGLTFNNDGSKMYISGTSQDRISEVDLTTPWDVTTATFNNVTSDVLTDRDPYTLQFADNGYKLYVLNRYCSALIGYSLSTAYDISTMKVGGCADWLMPLEPLDLNPKSIYFKPDGTELFFSGHGLDNIYNISLSTAWDLSTGTLNYTLDVSSQTSTPYGLTFNTAGTKMWVGDAVNTIYEYDLSDAWDLSTISLNYTKTGETAGADINDVFVSSDGSKFYYVDFNNDTVYTYPLSTAYDLSTAGTAVAWTGFTTQENQPRSIFFSSDGTKAYLSGSAGDDFNQYNLSSAWDLSTAVFDDRRKPLLSGNIPDSMFFSSDGLQLFVLDTGTSADEESIIKLTLSTAWDLSTVSPRRPNSAYFPEVLENNATGMTISTDGTKLYIIDVSPDIIYQYTLSTAFEITTATYDSISLDVTSQENSPRAIVFKPDGTKMFILGNGGDRVDEFALSTPWNISTASLTVTSASVGSTEGNAMGMHFSKDGKIFYITGTTSDRVDAFGLETAWDVTNIKPKLGYLLLTTTNTQAVEISPDGTNVYVCGENTDAVYQYELADPHNVYSGTFVRSLSVSVYGLNPKGIRFKPDGTRFLVCSSANAIFEYNLTTPWDISTATYANPVQQGAYGSSTDLEGFFYADNGTKLFMADNSNNQIDFRNLDNPWVAQANNIGASSIQLQNYGDSSLTTPTGVYVSPDGKDMFVSFYATNVGKVAHFKLATAYSFVTVTLQHVFTTNIQNQSDVTFKSDGTKMYIVTSGTDQVKQYDLSTPWDLTTAVSAQQLYSLTGQFSSPQGLYLSADEKKMFIVGEGVNQIKSYNLPSAGIINESVTEGFSFDISLDLIGGCRDIEFSSTGHRVYLLDRYEPVVHQYNLPD